MEENCVRATAARGRDDDDDDGGVWIRFIS